MAIISGNVGPVSNATVIYRSNVVVVLEPPIAITDAQGNHSSPPLSPGTYLVTAQAPGLVFNTVAVTIDAANPQNQVVNLRSRALNASNAFAL
jgi:hypothetical protein